MIYFQHPEQAGMDYWTHLTFSVSLSLDFMILSIKAIIHAIYPDIYVTSSTDGINYLQEKVNNHN